MLPIDPPSFPSCLFKGGKNFSSLTSKWWKPTTHRRPVGRYQCMLPVARRIKTFEAVDGPPSPVIRWKNSMKHRGWNFENPTPFISGWNFENPSETLFFDFIRPRCPAEKDRKFLRNQAWIWVKDFFGGRLALGYFVGWYPPSKCQWLPQLVWCC